MANKHLISTRKIQIHKQFTGKILVSTMEFKSWPQIQPPGNDAHLGDDLKKKKKLFSNLPELQQGHSKTCFFESLALNYLASSYLLSLSFTYGK